MSSVQIGGNQNLKKLHMNIIYNVVAGMAILLLFGGSGSIRFVEAFWIQQKISLSQFIIGEILAVLAIILAFCIHHILKELNFKD